MENIEGKNVESKPVLNTTQEKVAPVQPSVAGGPLPVAAPSLPSVSFRKDGFSLGAAAPPFKLFVPGPISITVHKDEKNPNIHVIKVDIQGMWTGNWIKGAVRALEKEYRAIKHKQTRKAAYNAEAMRQAQKKSAVSK